jgi:hypothetical protein
MLFLICCMGLIFKDEKLLLSTGVEKCHYKCLNIAKCSNEVIRKFIKKAPLLKDVYQRFCDITATCGLAENKMKFAVHFVIFLILASLRQITNSNNDL